jgi:hypothetical protein
MIRAKGGQLFGTRNRFRGKRLMLFKVIFVDGSVEPIHANNMADAKIQATRKFRDRLVARVEHAGLMDMAARPPTNPNKPNPSK